MLRSVLRKRDRHRKRGKFRSMLDVVSVFVCPKGDGMQTYLPLKSA